MPAPIIYVCPNQGTFIRNWESPYFNRPRLRFPTKHSNMKRNLIKRYENISNPYSEYIRHHELPYNNLHTRFPVRYVNMRRLLPKGDVDAKCSFPRLEPPEEEGRDRLGMRNVLERQRRNDLKMRLNILRQNIPELVNNADAPQVLILTKAVDYLRELKIKEKKLILDIALERSRKMYLLERMQDLLS